MESGVETFCMVTPRIEVKRRRAIAAVQPRFQRCRLRVGPNQNSFLRAGTFRIVKSIEKKKTCFDVKKPPKVCFEFNIKCMSVFVNAVSILQMSN